MAKGQNLSAHQQKIVRRYYDNIDTIARQALGEIVSDLYLADSPKKLDALWKRAERALDKVADGDPKVRKALESRSVELLAAIVNAL